MDDVELVVFGWLGDEIALAQAEYLDATLVRVIDFAEVVGGIGILLYVTIMGLAIVGGFYPNMASTFIKKVLLMMIVTSAAFSLDFYNDSVAGLILGLERDLLEVFAGGGSAPTDIYDALDESLSIGASLIAKCLARMGGGWSISALVDSVVWFYVALILLVSTLLVTIFAALTLIIAKFLLSILLAVGPLFILALVFPATSRFFEMWLTQALGLVLTLGMVSMVVAFNTTIWLKFASVMNLDVEDGAVVVQNPLFAAIAVLAISLILAFATVKVASMASSLAGQMNSAGIGFRDFMIPFNAAMSTTNLLVGRPASLARQGAVGAAKGGYKGTVGAANHLRGRGSNTVTNVTQQTSRSAVPSNANIR